MRKKTTLTVSIKCIVLRDRFDYLMLKYIKNTQRGPPRNLELFDFQFPNEVDVLVVSVIVNGYENSRHIAAFALAFYKTLFWVLYSFIQCDTRN
jgi:hypothetical protein